MSPPSEAAAAERRQQLGLLRSSAASFAGKESPPSRARALRGKAPGFDLRFWSALAAQGWTGLLAPESAGGYGQGMAEMAEVAGALAAHAAPEPLVPIVVFAGRLLEACGDSEVARGLLAELAEGRGLPAVAWQEDATGEASFDARGGLAEPTAVCASGPGRLRLSGRKQHVRPGAAATGYIVTASSSEGLALVWLPAAVQGLERHPVALADGGYAARLDLHQADVPADHLLARGAAAQHALARAYDEALVLAAVELAAIARRMVTMTLDYLRTRKQFGKPIGSFQSLQHRAVDMHIQQELGAAVVAEALAALDAGVDGVPRALLAARAKARCSDAALAIAREAVQMHGAIGFTDEHDLGLYLQRALVLSAWLGNAAVQRRRYAALARGQRAVEGACA
ncbi:MAG: acyl-CoA dehydrogenase family protein [Burkholderiaceae bacterium]|nr:acyl-CoA dehydrogenase family protein [Burkholderiaceae bacterium]